MTDDLVGGEDDPEVDAYMQHREALLTMLSEFAEERDVDEGMLSAMLLDAAVSMSALDYALSVAKPSESGLKMNFDRFQRSFADLIRFSKKDARDHLGRIMAVLDEVHPAVGKDEA